MTESNTPILRDEFSSFQQEIRSDMREVRDGMVRADARADQAERRMGTFEVQLSDGLRAIRADLAGLKSIRFWVIGGMAAGGSAAGTAIFHALSAIVSQ